MEAENDLCYWLALLRIPAAGPRTISRWLDHFGTPEAFFRSSAVCLGAAGLNAEQIQAVMDPDWRWVEAELAWATITGHYLISRRDSLYPPLLREMSDPPLVLYVSGDPAVLLLPQIAMVGARSASTAGLQTAEQFARYLGAAGWVVTSGLAKGIDGASHRGTMAAGGKTIAVMGTGHRYIYPAVHQKLAEEIAACGGAIVSEFPLDTPPQAMNFPRRNRIIAGLSYGVLVVEAALKSGSLITARQAAEYNREVFAIPGSIHHTLSKGCHALIRQGAKLVERAEDILEEMVVRPGLASVRVPEVKKADSPTVLPSECRQLLALVDYAVTPIDMIVLRSGLTAGAVSSMLLVLELHGYIESVTGGYMRTAVN